MHEPSVLEINLSAIDQNVAAIRRLVGAETQLCPIVKADAYGLGAVRIARRLATAGAAIVAVYSLPQAVELVRGTEGGLPLPVLVLMPVADIRRGDEAARLLLGGRLELTVHDLRQLVALESLSERLATRIRVHVEVDTGMSRGGARPEEAARLLERIATSDRFQLRGVFTHFARSRVDRAATDAQLAVFDRLLSDCAAFLSAECAVHVASTYALLRHRRYHRSMVRFGLAWAGYGLEELEDGELEFGDDLLRPCLRWRSRVVQVKRIPKGTSVGYGSTWTAERATTTGLVPVGYADGFPVHRPPHGAPAAPQRVAVLLDSPRGIVREYAPVIGVVNMDQIVLDLTDLDLLGQPDDGVGLTVELVTPDPSAPNHLPTLAARAGMIPHEMLCRIHPKVPRVYSVDGVVEEPATEPVAAAQRGSSGSSSVAAAS